MAGTRYASTSKGDLLERVQYARDLAEACRLVLDEIVRAGQVERAALLVRHGDHVHTVGHGIEEERLRALTSPAGAAGRRLRRWMDAGAAADGDGEEFPEAGVEAATLVPLAGVGGTTASAVLLEDPERRGAAALPDSVRDVGSSLQRLLEVERLRARIERTEQHSTLLDMVVDALSDPVVLTDDRGNVLFANRRAEHLLCGRPTDSEGRRRAIRINDLLFGSFLNQTIGGGRPVGRELNLVDPSDGSDLIFEVLSLWLPPGAAPEGGLILVLRDISDLKQAVSELELQFGRSRLAEQQARRESARLNAILANVSDPILVTDDRSQIVLVNAEAERLFDMGGTPSESTPPGAARAVRVNDTRFTTLISDFLLQPDQRRVETLVLTDPTSGHRLPVEVVSSKIMGRGAEVTAIVSVLHDLTQIEENGRLTRELQLLNEGLEERVRRSTEELEERNERLEWQSRELQKASRLKSEFLANMSHELRTPINAMIGYTALLRDKIYGELNDRQEIALRKIHGASQHLLALINDILDLSRIEAGKMPFHLEPLRLGAMVDELTQTIEPMVREKGLDYRVDVSDDLPPIVADRTKVKQILLNLLSNSVKFTHEGSVTLTATLAPGGDRLRVEVEDTGIGIREEHVEAIFDDFRQVDQSSTRRYGGTGLGLSITRKLVALMGGDIRVESRYGEGSRFSVELPLRPTRDPEREEEIPAPLSDGRIGMPGRRQTAPSRGGSPGPRTSGPASRSGSQ